MLAFVYDGALVTSSGEAWLAPVLRALARGGRRVHAISFETSPEELDFAAEAYSYDPDGSVITRMFRDTPHGGRVVLHGARVGGDPAEALFDVLGALVPGHEPSLLLAVGGDAAARAVHRARAAFGLPYVLVNAEGSGLSFDPVLQEHAARVLDGQQIPTGVDAMSLRPLRAGERAERMAELCARLGAHRETAFATLRRRLDEIDWSVDRVVIAATEAGILQERFETVVSHLGNGNPLDSGPGRLRVLPLDTLPGALFATWLPCADVFIDLRTTRPPERPGVVEALAAGVIPVAVNEAGGSMVRQALIDTPDEHVAARLALGPAVNVGVEVIAAAIRDALRQGDALRTRLRQAAITQHDWSVVADRLLTLVQPSTPLSLRV